MDSILFRSPVTLSGLAALCVPSICVPVVARTEGNVVRLQQNDIKSYVRPVMLNRNSDLFKKINSFGFLIPNWDGYGASAPDTKVLINAKRFINSLPEAISSEIKEDNIVPTPYGTIVINFENENELVSIEIGNNKIGFFTEFNDSNDIILESKLFNQENLPRELISAFNKLYKGSMA